MFAKFVLFLGITGSLAPTFGQQPAAAPKPAAPNAAPAKPAGPRGTISGIVVEKGSKQPIERVQLLMVGPNGSQAGAVTNPEGKFSVAVAPGGYQITARLMGATGFIGVPTVKVVSVRQDEETKAEIELPKAAELSGHVIDSRGEPVQNARVTLLMRTYEVWSPNLIYLNTPFSAQTNDLGEYSFVGVPTDLAFQAFVEMVNPGTAEAVSTNAADPNLRRPILAGTFYPQTLDPGGAQSIMLSEGERRENVDIRMVQSKSYCAEGALLPAKTDIPHSINIDLNSVVSGVFNGYGSFRSGRVVSLDQDGRARVCGLWPGEYRFTVQPIRRGAQPQPQAEFFGLGQFTITDKDLTTINGKIGPTFDWKGEVIL